MSVKRGQHVWYDLMTTDTAAATDFYKSVVGWGTQPFEGSEQPYEMWTAGDRPIGGKMDLPPQAREAGAPPHWIAYISTPDTDATAAKAAELGGTVLMPGQDIPEVGRFAILQDPFGAVFAAFTPAGDEPPPSEKPQPGNVSWHELMTDDHEKAYAFYSELFGWEKGDPMDMGPAGIYQLFRQEGGADIGGMMNRPEGMPVSAWLYYVNVANLDEALEQVTANGGQILNGPMEVPGGDKIAQCMDPQGGAFALHMYASA